MPALPFRPLRRARARGAAAAADAHVHRRPARV